MGTTVMGSTGSGSAAWAEVKAGVYGATLASYESLGMQSFNNGPERERMKLRFELDGETDKETGEPISLYLFANLVLTPKSSLSQIITDMGLDWTPGQAFDLDELVGRRCQVIVKRVDGPNGERPQITGLLPAKGGAAAQQADAAPFNELDPCFICAGPGALFDAQGRSVCEKHANV